MATSNSRKKDIDIARAVAMSLVILHHTLQFFPRYGLKFADVSTLKLVIEVITWIHMPVFTLIAGYVLALGGKEIQGLRGYLSFERGKLFRLILPYLAICSLQLLVKLLSGITKLSEVPDVLIGIFIAPHAGSAPHGWFLYTLMLILVIWPFLRRLADRNRWPAIIALLLFLAILPIPWPRKNPVSCYFELERLTWYLPMFIFGYWYYHRVKGSRHPGFGGIVFTGCIFVGAFLVRLQYMEKYSMYSMSTPCPNDLVLSFLLNLVRAVGSLCGALCVLWISGKLAILGGRITSCIARLGLYSYDIYLLHVIVGHMLIVAISRLQMNTWASLAVFPVVMFCTIAMAYELGQFIRRFPRFAFVILGLPLRKLSKAGPERLSCSSKTSGSSG